MSTTHFVDLHVIAPPDQLPLVHAALKAALNASEDAEGWVRAPSTTRKPWPFSAGRVSMFFTRDGKTGLSSKELAKDFEAAVLKVDPRALVLSVGFCLDEAEVWCRHPGKDGFKTLVVNDAKQLEDILEADWNSVVASQHLDNISNAMLPFFLESKPVRKAFERAGFDVPSPKVQAKRRAVAML